jgi:hypothetical protein
MPENFIHQAYLEDTSICDTIIDAWQTAKLHNKVQPGSFVGAGGISKVRPDMKDSLDLPIDFRHVDPKIEPYFAQLHAITEQYIEKFPYSKEFCPFGLVEGPNIQYYPPGGGYKLWHTERSFPRPPQALRHLVWMTYLNDVEDGGTEFFHQGITTQARKGLTLIWPADWTYTHRGQISQNQEKWIITGWYNFLTDYI